MSPHQTSINKQFDAKILCEAKPKRNLFFNRGHLIVFNMFQHLAPVIHFLHPSIPKRSSLYPHQYWGNVPTGQVAYKYSPSPAAASNGSDVQLCGNTLSSHFVEKKQRDLRSKICPTILTSRLRLPRALAIHVAQIGRHQPLAVYRNHDFIAFKFYIRDLRLKLTLFRVSWQGVGKSPGPFTVLSQQLGWQRKWSCGPILRAFVFLISLTFASHLHRSGCCQGCCRRVVYSKKSQGRSETVDTEKMLTLEMDMTLHPFCVLKILLFSISSPSTQHFLALLFRSARSHREIPLMALHQKMNQWINESRGVLVDFQWVQVFESRPTSPLAVRILGLWMLLAWVILGHHICLWKSSEMWSKDRNDSNASQW